MSRCLSLAATFICAGVLGVTGVLSPSHAKEKIKVGFIGPLTGGTSANGLGGRNSADLAVRLRNADAEAKYEYEMVALDDECKPNVGVQQATKLATDREIIAAATHYCSAVAIATVDVYHKFGLPVIVWGAVLPDITYRNKYAEVHRVNGTMINQNERNAELLPSLGYKTFAVIHDTTDYGKGHNKYFSEALAKHGGKIVGTFGVTSDQQDFSAELTQIKSLNPQAIYFGGLTPIGVRIRGQMDKLGLNTVLFDGTSGIKSDSYIDGLGKLAEGSLSFIEGGPTERLPGGKFFLEKYNAQNYPNPPEAYGGFAFAAMSLILDTIEEVGPDRKKVQATLNKVKDRDSIVGKITFDDHGQNTVALITAFVVQDGKWVVWEDSEYASGKRKLPGQN
ncbi:branched chain amino acid ABC transporter substrate-binding protein [Bradyrhizobium genosp. SA-3]|uniref:branched-chain amino acid ABC transporter substrate-binding protein n=1 Tax=Bradyrhizobium genosp. SA-3 TaxID=508868 RepID=UPI001028A3DF|nr:branched-chain amino acid ABC transporter substrate-binding protein [Bradyrhizobium genosp. SA-3]RZM99466.1 branched chain amino acid ABC transporter substrate-binding protein [Bradyrhizobium genosp. SA-3]